jgi:mxaJ protein
MFSSFLSSEHGHSCPHERGSGLRIPHGGMILLIGTIMALSFFSESCSTTDQSVSAEPKHYIEPPKQKKIPVSTTAFRVCADPNNLPFTNQKGEGFENKIAELIGKKLGLPVEYTWFAQRRGFFRNTLREGRCDAVIGAPERFERADSTDPYYYSSYVFVSRNDRKLNIVSFDDPQLKNLKIGVQMIGDDALNTPPAHLLADRGIIDNVVGYSVYGEYTEPNPPSKIIDAVINKDVDIAVIWGPLAGYFAAKQKIPLDIRPVAADPNAKLPTVFGISIAVRYGEDEFKQQLNDILNKDRGEIDRILADYHIPTVPEPAQKFDMEGGE